MIISKGQSKQVRMESNSPIKEFYCKIHRSKPIKKVCLESTTMDCLFCDDCATSNAKHLTLLEFEDYLKKIAEHYNTTKNILEKAEITELPTESQEFIKGKRDSVLKLHQHVCKLKENIKNNFDQLIQKMSDLIPKILNDEKEKILKELDKQVPTLIANFEAYEKKLPKFYQDVNKIAQLDHKKLIAQINERITLENLEDFVREINQDISENQTFLNIGKSNRSALIQYHRNGVQRFAEEFKNPNFLAPKVSLANESSIQAIISNFTTSLNNLIEGHLNIDNSMVRCNMSLWLLQEKDKALLSTWISEYKNPKFELLYRGSRDGFTATSFHKKCDNKGPTVVIIRSNLGKVFGGFTDIAWDSSDTCKSTKNAFLFSIDRRAKYPLTPGKEGCAIYCNANYGPTFGGGHDICIYNDCNTSKVSYSHFPTSYTCNEYANKGKSDYLAGAYNFTVIEIEVYSV